MITTCPGQSVPYTVTVTNIGSFTAFNLVVTDTLPAGFTVGTSSAGILQRTLGNLAPHASTTYQYLAKIEPGTPAGTYRNTAVAKIDNGGSPNNTATASFVVRVNENCSGPIMTLEKTQAESFTNAGGSVTYSLTVENIGPVVLANVVLTDVLPDGFSSTDGTTSWPLGNIAAGSGQTLTFTANVARTVAPGEYVNVGKAIADNHGEVIAESAIEVRAGQVLGKTFTELPDTGSGMTVRIYLMANLLAFAAGYLLYQYTKRYELALG